LPECEQNEFSHLTLVETVEKQEAIGQVSNEFEQAMVPWVSDALAAVWGLCQTW
jgi:hypothetical protein